MKRALVLLAGFTAAAIALLAGFEAAAQEGTLKKIKDSGSITIGHRDASIPFSYYDDKQQPVGYAVDLCMRIVDAVKSELKMPNLKVNYQLVTSANRIPLMANGTIDLECGSTTNNLERQKQGGFTITPSRKWPCRSSPTASCCARTTPRSRKWSTRRWSAPTSPARSTGSTTSGS